MRLCDPDQFADRLADRSAHHVFPFCFADRGSDHHIADRPAYFSKVREQLREGGRLIIVDFRKDAASDIPGPPPAMRVAHDVLVDELEGAGWKHVRTDLETLPHQYMVELVPGG